MRQVLLRALSALLVLSWLFAAAQPTAAESVGEPVDLVPRLQEIYNLRAQSLLANAASPPVDLDFLPNSKTAVWALNHEHGKLKYMQQWVKNRGVRMVEAESRIRVKELRRSPDRARFYVEQALTLGYVYPDEPGVNRFGVGTRHIIELRPHEGKWLIALEWYTDPLGDDTEVPDVMPALVPEPLPQAVETLNSTAAEKRAGYDRDGAVRYADQFCGLAWGCGNENRYHPKYRDYNGVGGDCTNYVSQALKEGGKLNVPVIARVDTLAAHLTRSGRAVVTHRATFQALWKEASSKPQGFQSMLQLGDLIAYQEKGKLEHFGLVTGFDSNGYPVINSHSADRYHVPFDLGWDRKTIYWLFRMKD